MELIEVFKDRPPKEQAEILELMDLLRENPRLKFSEAGREMGLALSTAHDRWLMIKKRLKMTVTFEVLMEGLPKPVLKCPACRSIDTEPQMVYKEGMGTQVIGLICRACGNKARRSQLPKSVVAAVELAACGGKI